MPSARANQKDAIAAAAAIKSLLLDTDVVIGAWWEDERILPLTEFSRDLGLTH
ncbi:hypothetical protein [Leptothoe spongobia]|uniref:Uncharacterized protein n=1 Tax=Leptothoe spongobia TAU-MAC 1115 TaxID=1967444 RepID=A0A947DKC0_9CYAN|nr:hypothetical protein [Leptothoe spongobia]MBT9318048.1 hypothetical protein [Leptothoe spongobia TAU-MAC 1115]